MPYYRDEQAAIARRRESKRGDAFRRGAKQPLQRLDRTIGGHVAGLMPHEYNSSSSSSSSSSSIDDETPRTARAFAANSQALPSIAGDMQKRPRGIDRSSFKKKTDWHAMRRGKENSSNNTHTRTPPKKDVAVNDSFRDASKRSGREADSKRRDALSSSAQEGKENENSVYAAPTKRSSGARRQDTQCNPATPTRLYVAVDKETENENENENEAKTEDYSDVEYQEDPSEYDAAPCLHSPPMTPSAAVSMAAVSTPPILSPPTVTAAHQFGARRTDGNESDSRDLSEQEVNRRMSDLGIELEEKSRQHSAASGARQPPVSPLKSPHPNSDRYRHQQSSVEPDSGSFRGSPEPETARASQFVSDRSPAAAMARLRRMKQERKHGTPQTPRRSRSRSRSRSISETKHQETTDAKQHRYEEHHPHQHHEEKYETVDENDPNPMNGPPSQGGRREFSDIIFSRARHGRLDEVQKALDDGMDVNSRDNHGSTLLHVACQNGNKKLVKALLRRHADINAINKSGNTSLHFCFMYAYYGLAEYIMSKGANDTIRNHKSQTPYDVDR